MQKKIVSILVCLVLLSGLVSCRNIEIPEGIENKAFYKDMVECIRLAEKTLKTKNEKHIKEMGQLIIKHTEENYYKMIFGLAPPSEEMDNSYGLNDKELDILINVNSLITNLSQYLDEYYSDHNADTDVLIDTNSFHGKILYKSFQEVISIMELDYQIKIK